MPTRKSVALLAEGVDRNLMEYYEAAEEAKSPSSRRAWIEIFGPYYPFKVYERRPPRGGRG